MSNSESAARKPAATTDDDAQITTHRTYNKYGELYTYHRCEGCGDEAFYRHDLMGDGCSCA